jgi:2OG-Fe(II) oxygenase superfamily
MTTQNCSIPSSIGSLPFAECPKHEYERSPKERSAFTFMIYLNGGVAGGATEFNLRSRGGVQNDDPIVRVQPELGKALVFPHRILHRGAPVADGRKYVLRTDVMCSWAG